MNGEILLLAFPKVLTSFLLFNILDYYLLNGWVMKNRQIYILSLVFLVFIVGTLTLIGLDTERANNFGTYLSGLSTFLILLVALVKLGPELDRWYDEKDKERDSEKDERNFAKEEKVADAAEFIATTAMEFIQSVQYITSPLIYSGENPPDEYLDEFRDNKAKFNAKSLEWAVNNRIRKKHQEFEKFGKARNLAKLYMSKSANEFLESIWRKWLDTIVSIETYVMYAQDGLGQDPLAKTAYKKFFYKESRDEWEELNNQLIDQLEPRTRDFISRDK